MSTTTNGHHHHHTNGNHGRTKMITTTSTVVSTTALEQKLQQLREQANQHGQILTQKLASSQSGQNLLHMGTRLATLPPDLHSLLQQLYPMLSATELTEQEQLQALQRFVETATEIRQDLARVQHALASADAYADLVAAEEAIRQDVRWRRYGKAVVDDLDTSLNKGQQEEQDWEATDDEEGYDDLDHASSLERAAHIVLCLVDDLQSANEAVSAMTAGQQPLTTSSASSSTTSTNLPSLQTPLHKDTEQAQFFLKLAPRIRKLESDTTQCLCQRMELILNDLQELQQQNVSDEGKDEPDNNSKSQELLLLMLGHCMRGLVLLGRGKEVESIFARVAIMPLIRSQVSMGRLDQGGARGECAGLVSLLDEMTDTIAATYGPVLRYADCMFEMTDKERDVDLLTAGVWVPIATALMADTGIKMAIFSPGIASILQTNYTVLDSFLAQLGQRLLTSSSSENDNGASNTLYYQSAVTPERIQQAQERIYRHPKTAEFSKKWNLPIYYQLRFGDCCKRLNLAIDTTQLEGWVAQVFAGSSPEQADQLRSSLGFELSLFLELYDILLTLWLPDVILRPLTNRFLRGAVQLVGRVVSFIQDGMDGTIQFGDQPPVMNGSSEMNGDSEHSATKYPTRSRYCWGESENDVAAVAWELTILESTLRHDYTETVCSAIVDDASATEADEIKTLVTQVLQEACDQIHPVIGKAWNELIVNILTTKCAAPLAAVKGVAATYRMTNRPPPSQASPFVTTILRPLKEFCAEFANRTPERVGLGWKQQIVVTISDKYAAAVEELLATVQRTEEALQRQTRSRRAARLAAATGLSDGEKVKLQLYLDYQTFLSSVHEAGINPKTVIGLSKLEELTKEGKALQQQSPQNGI